MKLQTKKITKTLVFSAMALSLSACELLESDDDDEGVETPNNAPSITSTGVLSVEAGNTYSYTLAATDSDGDTLTLEASSLPSWLSFDATSGVLSGTPAASDEGSHSVTLSVSDGTSSTTQSFTINGTVPAVNNAPVVSSTAATTATEGTEYSYTLAATDSDGDTLTMAATTLPAWLSFDAASGVLSGTPAASDAGVHDVVLTVADAEDSVTESFSITVSALPVDTTPTTGALAIFDDSVETGWFAWDESGEYAPVVATDDDSARGEVIEFKITGNQVAGFSTRDVHGATNGIVHDASSISTDGTFSFDLKMTQEATSGAVTWYVKLESTDAATAVEYTLPASQEGHSAPVLDTWQTYTFNLKDFADSGLDTSAIDVVMIFPQWGQSDGAMYKLDNVQFNADGAMVVDSGTPEEGASAPTVSASDVISIFSDSYTSVDGVNVNPDWGQATATSIVDIAGNNTVVMENLNYQGIEFPVQDISGKTTLHLDYWTADATGFDVFLISTGAETYHRVTPTTGSWQTLSIPLSEYSDVVDLMDIFQFKFDAQAFTGGTIYFDNIYFSSSDSSSGSGGSGDTAPTTAAPTPTEASDDVVSIFSSYSDAAGLNVNPDWGQATATSITQVAGDDTVIMENLNYQGIEFTALDLTGKETLHIDYWTADATGFDIFLINGGETYHRVDAPVTGSWQSLEISLSEYASAISLDGVYQFKFDAQAFTGGTIYFDNIYFSGTGDYGTDSSSELSTAAPTPTADAANVISVFSDAYTAVDSVNTNPGWGQATITSEVDVAGNNTLKMVNLNYQGIEFASQDISGKTTLNVNYYTDDATGFDIFLIGGGAETYFRVDAPVTGSWQTLAIPLSTYSGVVDLTQVIQFKFVAQAFSTTNTIYFDNLYFD